MTSRKLASRHASPSTFSVAFIVLGWFLIGVLVIATLVHVSSRVNVHDPTTFVPILVAALSHLGCLVWLLCAARAWHEVRGRYGPEEAQITRATVAVMVMVNSVPYVMLVAGLFVHGG